MMRYDKLLPVLISGGLLLAAFTADAASYDELMEQARNAPVASQKSTGFLAAAAAAPDDAKRLAAYREGFEQTGRMKNETLQLEFARKILECPNLTHSDKESALYLRVIHDPSISLEDVEDYLKLPRLEQTRQAEAMLLLAKKYIQWFREADALKYYELLAFGQNLEIKDRVRAASEFISLLRKKNQFREALAVYDRLLKEDLPLGLRYSLILERCDLLQSGAGYYYEMDAAALDDLKKAYLSLLQRKGLNDREYFNVFDRYISLHAKLGDREKVIELYQAALNDKKRAVGPFRWPEYTLALGRALLHNQQREQGYEVLMDLDSKKHSAMSAWWYGEACFCTRRLTLALGSLMEARKLMASFEDDRPTLVYYALLRVQKQIQNTKLFNEKMKRRKARIAAENPNDPRLKKYVPFETGNSMKLGAPAKKKEIKKLEDISVESDLATDGLEL